MDVEGGEESEACKRRKVDIFSHFGRLIGESGADEEYRKAFEQNNLLVNIGHYPNGFHPHTILKNERSSSHCGSPALDVNIPEKSCNPDDSGRQRDQKIWTEVQAIVYSNSQHDLENSGSGQLIEQPEEQKTVPASKTKCYPARPPMLPPCRVCGDSASGFHYGVNTCEACKGFFRRSIVKATPYTCVNSGDCKMVLGRRTSCSACRYKRCLEVGMSKHAIKTGRYTHELRSKNILEVKRLEKQKSEERSLSHIPTVGSTAVSSPRPPGYSVNLKSEPSSVLKHGELEWILQELLEGQTCLYEFLDEYYDTELMLARQRAVYERYLADKAKRELWEELYGSGTPAQTDVSARFECQTQLHEDNKHGCETFTQRQTGCKIASNRLECETTLIESRPLFETATCKESQHELDTSTGNRPESLQSQRSSPCTPLRESGQFRTDFNSDQKCSEPSVSKQSVIPQEELKPILGDVSKFGRTTSMTEALKAEVLARFLEDMKRGVNGMLAFSKKIPGFEDLPNEDQVALVQAARFDIWCLGHIRCFNHELLVGACEWKFHAEELSKVWGEELVKKTFDLSKLGLRLDLNKEETAALRGLSVSFADRCYPLRDTEAVEQIHQTMLNVLKYTVLKRHPDFNTWFREVIRFLTNIREVGELYVKYSSNLKLEWSVLENNPTLLEVFLS